MTFAKKGHEREEETTVAESQLASRWWTQETDKNR